MQKYSHMSALVCLDKEKGYLILALGGQKWRQFICVRPWLHFSSALLFCNFPILLKIIFPINQYIQGASHKGLKLSKRFTNLPSDSSGCPGEKGRSCIKRKKKLYFLHVLPFSPWDSQFKLTSEKTGTLCSDFTKMLE